MNRRLESLQGLRFIAFLSIFLNHCGITNFTGNWGACVFFVLSGFLMTYNYSNRILDKHISSAFLFGAKRIRKIYPLHVFTMLVMLLAEVPTLLSNKGSFLFFSLKGISNFLLIQSWIPFKDFYFSFNGVSWYLSTALFIYITFPYIIEFIKSKTKRQSVLLISALFLALAAICTTIYSVLGPCEVSVWLTKVFPVYCLVSFIVGCLLCVVYLNTDFKLRSYSIFEIVLVCLIFVSFYIVNLKPNNWALIGLIRPTMVFLPSATLTVFFMAANRGIISKLISNKVLCWLGNLTMYGYLIHNVVIRYCDILFRKIYKASLNIWIFAFVCLVVTICLSYIYMLVQKRIERKN